MEVTCKRCGTSVKPSEDNRKKGYAHCDNCSTLFWLPDEAETQTGPNAANDSSNGDNRAVAPAQTQTDSAEPEPELQLDTQNTASAAPASTNRQPPRDEPDFDLPSRLEIREWGKNFHLAKSWPRIFGVIMLAVVFVAMPYTIQQRGGFWEANPMILWGAVLVFGPMWLYFALACLLNDTHIRIDSEAGNLRIERGPIPWLGDRTVPVTDLEQLFVTEYVSNRGRSASYKYHLKARVAGHDADSIVLVHGLNKPADALAMERVLEQYLDIKDQPVPGEYSETESKSWLESLFPRLAQLAQFFN